MFSYRTLEVIMVLIMVFWIHSMLIRQKPLKSDSVLKSDLSSASMDSKEEKSQPVIKDIPSLWRKSLPKLHVGKKLSSVLEEVKKSGGSVLEIEKEENSVVALVAQEDGKRVVLVGYN